MEKNKNEKKKKSKLSLDDFKMKSSLAASNNALDAITGGILGACHDGTGSGCTVFYSCSTYMGY